MIAAVVALTLALAACVTTLLWALHRYDSLVNKFVALQDKERSEWEMAERYLQERDESIKHSAELDDLARSLKLRVSNLEIALNQARQEATNAVVERIRSSSVPDAARLLDELLASPLPGTTQT